MTRFFCLLCCLVSAQVFAAKQLDTTRIKVHIQNVRLKPMASIQKDVDTLVLFISSNGTANYIDSALATLKSLFYTEKRAILLRSLSRFPSDQFDEDLSSITENLDSLQNNNITLFLQAVKKCGGPFTYQSLVSACKTKIDPGNIRLQDLKVACWKLLMDHSYLAAVNHLFSYYSYDYLGMAELQANPHVADLLLSVVDEAKHNEFLFYSMEGRFKDFCFSHDLNRLQTIPPSPKQFPSILVGAAGSQKLRMVRSIFDLFEAYGTVRSLAALAEFTRCDNEDLRMRAGKISYKKLSDPYLFPRWVNYTKDSMVAKLLDLHFPIQKYSSPYLHPQNFAAVWELDTTVFNGLDLHSNRDQIVTIYHRDLSPMVKTAKSHYSLPANDSTLPVADFLETDGRWIPKFSHNFIDFQNQGTLLSQYLARAFVRQGYKPNTADTCGLIIAGKEFDKKAVMAYALAMAKKRFGKQLSDVNCHNLEQKLDTLSRMLTGKIVKSSFVSSLTGNPTGIPAGLSGVIDSIAVLERKYALTEGLYQELVACYRKKVLVRKILWTGILPVHVISLLINTPRIFDLTDFSFAYQDWVNLANKKDVLRDFMDIVRNDPNASLSYLLYYINGTNVSWSDIRESIALNELNQNMDLFRKMSPFFTAHQAMIPVKKVDLGPLPDDLGDVAKNSLQLGMPGGVFGFAGVVIAPSDSVYEQRRTESLQPFFYLLINKTYRRINEIILQYNKDLPEDKPCDLFDVFCHADIIRVEDKDRTRVISAVEGTIQKLRKAENYLKAWDLGTFTINEQSTVIMRQMILKPDLSEFVGTYEVRTGEQVRYVNLGGKLTTIPPQIKRALLNDPSFLAKYNLDLSGAATGSSRKISHALQRAFNSEYIGGVFQTLLAESGYDLIRPWGLGFTAKGPLLESEAGQLLATEATFLNRLLTSGLGGSLEDENTPTSTFIAAVRDYWSAAAKMYESNAVQNAAAIIEAAKNARKDWEVSIGFTQHSQNGGVTFSLNIRINDFTIRISTSPSLEDIKFSFAPPGLKTMVTFNLDNLLAKDQPQFNEFDKQTAGSLASNLSRLNFSDIPTLAAVNSIMNTRTITVPGDVTYRTLRHHASLASVGLVYYEGPEVSVNLPRSWVELSPLNENVWVNAPESGDRAWLHSMIYQARTKFTDDEVAQLHKAASSGFFPSPLVDILIQRRNAAIADEKIKSGQWITTDVPSAGIIPTEIIRNGATVAQYIDDFNKTSTTNFEKAITDKKNLCETKRIFEDGLPGLRISYSSDFEYMLWTYTYKCVDGTTLENYNISKVYPGLVPLIKKDPNGHVLEKLSAIVADDFIKFSNIKNPLRRAELRKIQEIQKAAQDPKAQEALSKGLREHISGALKEYFDKWKKWLKDNGNGKSGVETPLQPSPTASPILNFLPPPYEVYLRKRAAIEQTAQSCRDSELGDDIRNGTVILVPRR